MSLSDKIIDQNKIHCVSYSRLLSLRSNSTVQDLYLAIYRLMRVHLDIYKQAKGKPEVKINIDLAD